MPLFASWRHPPMPHASGDLDNHLVRKGAHSPGVSSFVFSSVTSIEEALHSLHVQQRVQGTRHIQAEIDRYLFACISPSLSHLILPRNNAPHYDNLPDISHYALGILDPTMDTSAELQQVLLLLRQCTPLRRRTKRAQREVLCFFVVVVCPPPTLLRDLTFLFRQVQWRRDSMHAMQTLVRCLQGTFLGLYPNCLKAITFLARVSIIRFLRSVLVLDFPTLHKCMQKIRYITKLCIMEHLCNTIYDYHPGICHTLNSSGQKFEHFCNSVSSICDIFRSELNTAFASVCKSTDEHLDHILVILPTMERLAHSYFERCTRAYRGIIIGHTMVMRNIDHARRLSKVPRALDGLFQHLPLIYMTSTQNVFDLVNAHLVPSQYMELLWFITQIITVHQLPRCILRQQLEALSKRYHHDTTCISMCRMLHVCVQCVIRRGNATGMLLRRDCRTGQLMCVQCGPGSVLALDMLGRIATIGSDVLLLSSCCGSFIQYKGSGYEYNTTCSPHCAHGLNSGKRRDRKHRLIAAPTPLTCCMCRQRNTMQTLQLLHVQSRQMLSYALCARHRVPQHIAKTLWDKSSLDLYYQIQRTNQPSRVHKAFF